MTDLNISEVVTLQDKTWINSSELVHVRLTIDKGYNRLWLAIKTLALSPATFHDFELSDEHVPHLFSVWRKGEGWMDF